ncbi:MAG: repressor LexA [Pyrinomonadaceae bacterium]|nr:repressor LexA [Pyrinomonadaceae bacterium]
MSQRKSAVLTNSDELNGFKTRVLDAFGGISIEQIAELTNINHHTLGNYLRRKRDIPTEELIKLSKVSGASIDWLLTGEGSRYISASVLPVGESSVYFGEMEHEIIEDLAEKEGRAFDEQVRELVLESLKARGLITDQVQGIDLIFFGKEVPTLKPMRLLGEIAAGRPIGVFEVDETVLVPEEFFVQGRRNFALRVKGDSMEDEGILDGDIIICYESQTAGNGDTVVALIDGSQATVKKFYKERNRIRLQPMSKKHKPILLEPEKVKIQGVVVGIFRKTQ